MPFFLSNPAWMSWSNTTILMPALSFSSTHLLITRFFLFLSPHHWVLLEKKTSQSHWDWYQQSWYTTQQICVGQSCYFIYSCKLSPLFLNPLHHLHLLLSALNLIAYFLKKKMEALSIVSSIPYPLDPYLHPGTRQLTESVFTKDNSPNDQDTQRPTRQIF